MTQDVEMKDNLTPTQSVVSTTTSTLQHLKEIAALIDTGSYTKEVRRIARVVRLTVGLRQKLTGSIISSFLDFALVPGSEAHTRLSCFVPKLHGLVHSWPAVPLRLASCSVVAARGGMETLRPALHRLYMTRASHYKDALASFIKGYHEGLQQVMQNKEESKPPADEADNSKKTS